jgi:hypothetical protein
MFMRGTHPRTYTHSDSRPYDPAYCRAYTFSNMGASHATDGLADTISDAASPSCIDGQIPSHGQGSPYMPCG